VTCLITAINTANKLHGKHTINLEAGIYTLQNADNGGNGVITANANGLPVITGSIRIRPSADDPPTVMERDPSAPFFRIFSVAAGGELSLEGLYLRGAMGSQVRYYLIAG